MLNSNNEETIDGYYYFLASDDLDMYFKGTVARQGNSAGKIIQNQMKFVDDFENLQGSLKLPMKKYERNFK